MAISTAALMTIGMANALQGFTAMQQGASMGVQASIAAKETIDLGELNVRRIDIETRENMRRLQSQQDETMGQAKNILANSGFKIQDTGSQTYLDELQSSFDTEKSWLRLSSDLQKKITRKTAYSQARQLRQQGRNAITSGGSQLFSSTASTIGMVGQANNWWQS